MPRSPKKRSSSSSGSSSTHHPTYKEMITAAIFDDAKWKNGSSREVIKKYILANYDVAEKDVKLHLARALRTLKQDGPDGYPYLEQVRGSFKLTNEWKDEWKDDRKKKKSKKNSDDDDSDDDSKKKKRSSSRKSSSKKKTTKRKRTKKNVDPKRPKRPLTAYFLYLKDHRDSYKKRHPDYGVTHITKGLSAKWRALSKDELDVYKAKAEKEKKKYKKALAEYEANKSTTESSSDSDSDSSSDEESSVSASASTSEKSKSSHKEKSTEESPKKRKKST